MAAAKAPSQVCSQLCRVHARNVGEVWSSMPNTDSVEWECVEGECVELECGGVCGGECVLVVWVGGCGVGV